MSKPRALKAINKVHPMPNRNRGTKPFPARSRRTVLARVSIAAVAAFVLLALPLASGCTNYKNSKSNRFWQDYLKNKRTAPTTRGDFALRPGFLTPVSGTFTWKDKNGTGFQLEMPEGGWFITKGRSMPDAVVIFVQGDREKPDIVIAAGPAAPDPAGKTDSDRARDYFTKSHRTLTPSDAAPCPATREACSLVSGPVTDPSKARPGFALDSARFYYFSRPDAGSYFVAITLNSSFTDVYQTYIDDIIRSFVIIPAKQAVSAPAKTATEKSAMAKPAPVNPSTAK